MGYTNAYTAYQNTNIKTASQGKLIVLLYEAAVRNMNSANSLVNNENKIKACDIEKFSTYKKHKQSLQNYKFHLIWKKVAKLQKI